MPYQKSFQHLHTKITNYSFDLKNMLNLYLWQEFGQATWTRSAVHVTCFSGKHGLIVEMLLQSIAGLVSPMTELKLFIRPRQVEMFHCMLSPVKYTAEFSSHQICINYALKLSSNKMEILLLMYFLTVVLQWQKTDFQNICGKESLTKHTLLPDRHCKFIFSRTVPDQKRPVFTIL